MSLCCDFVVQGLCKTIIKNACSLETRYIMTILKYDYCFTL